MKQSTQSVSGSALGTARPFFFPPLPAPPVALGSAAPFPLVFDDDAEEDEEREEEEEGSVRLLPGSVVGGGSPFSGPSPSSQSDESRRSMTWTILCFHGGPHEGRGRGQLSSCSGETRRCEAGGKAEGRRGTDECVRTSTDHPSSLTVSYRTVWPRWQRASSAKPAA